MQVARDTLLTLLLRNVDWILYITGQCNCPLFHHFSKNNIFMFTLPGQSKIFQLHTSNNKVKKLHPLLYVVGTCRRVRDCIFTEH